MVHYSSVTLDPAGRVIASVESTQVKDAPSEGHGLLVLRDTNGKLIARQDPCATCRYASLAFSPDGATLAFVASGGGNATVYALAKGQVRKLTSVNGLAAGLRWSPDGKTIALLVTVGATKETGATQPGARQVGVIGEHEDSKRIATIPATGGPIAMVSPEGTFVYEYDWTPDGQGFVGTAAEGNGDNQWWVASLRAFPIAGPMRTIAAPKMQMNFPRVSPDGKSVAFIGGLMSDFGSVGGDIYSVPIAGGPPRNLTPDVKVTFTSLAWSRNQLLVSAIVSGSSAVGWLYPATGKLTLGAPSAESMAAGDAHVSLDRSGTRAAYVTESFTKAPSIAFGPIGVGKSITHDNDALTAAFVAHDIRWKSGGEEVQGWLLEPQGASATAKQPMITIIHGGPAAATMPRFIWGGNNEALLAHGYWLFQPNPRGSYGHGEAFVRANVKDFGGGDLEDDLAGIAAVEKQAPIDDDRLGIFGHSYGGFMTMWTVTHSKRFKAAVAGAGIADWVAYYGQNGIDQWMIPYFGASAYDDYATYDRLSPIRSIRRAATPTFIYVGERDVECPPAQSLEFWHGLRAMNVPTELVIYADEGHGIRKPANTADITNRMVGWFDRYLK
ncbi:dipeptidyl aminopeptidase/acylaminoacyl peptidase [Sphingomonas vulcanisoli]|uniref:Dipeptidyl aminopeptidase/acylaminoacyl peptidase n=1 Tax=Sphingomonas vulcanisoli TaxID=1658060 RepID=A0ABX0TTF8_9SPHN|nr:S9 family peptidase [Sphingomonas vulcanisoli]NIJ08024.1 dipeptidyl aminopeptidase/acylaminoacyl peptidase [Sphingomonas vulcanisoli]